MDNEIQQQPSMGVPVALAVTLTAVTVLFAYLDKKHQGNSRNLAVVFAGLSSLAWQDVLVRSSAPSFSPSFGPEVQGG